MRKPSEHLLKTFASVPVESRVLDLGCGEGRHTEPLARLGFDLYACDPHEEAVAAARRRVGARVGEERAAERVVCGRPDALGYPDEHFDWVVAYEALEDAHTREALLEIFGEVRRVLKDGGWVYLAVPAVPEEVDLEAEGGYAGDSGLTLTFTPETLTEVMEEAGFALAQRAERTDDDAPLLLAIYRRVDEHTPA